jgi:acetone carboxylase gamma subunit
MNKISVTEYLDIDLDTETWSCNRCNAGLGSARQPYLRSCLVHDRTATEIYGEPMKLADGQTVSYAPDPGFCHILEFYCPQCGTMMEVQYLMPGHPVHEDITLDIDQLKAKYQKE